VLCTSQGLPRRRRVRERKQARPVRELGPVPAAEVVAALRLLAGRGGFLTDAGKPLPEARELGRRLQDLSTMLRVADAVAVTHPDVAWQLGWCWDGLNGFQA